MSTALFTASAVLWAALPVQAFPNASVNLIRVTSEGVTAMPGLNQALLPGSSPAPAQGPLLSQATPPAAETSTLLAKASDPLVLSFAGPLPTFGADDYVSIRVKSSDATLNNQEVEQIRFDSPSVVISPDRRTITITPTQPLQDGQTLAALLPTGDYVLPLATSSCFFQLAPPVAALPPVIPPAPPPPPPFPLLPVLLGIGAAAVIGCAIGGCFSGTAGTNSSSN